MEDVDLEVELGKEEAEEEEVAGMIRVREEEEEEGAIGTIPMHQHSMSLRATLKQLLSLGHSTLQWCIKHPIKGATIKAMTSTITRVAVREVTVLEVKGQEVGAADAATDLNITHQGFDNVNVLCLFCLLFFCRINMCYAYDASDVH